MKASNDLCPFFVSPVRLAFACILASLVAGCPGLAEAQPVPATAIPRVVFPSTTVGTNVLKYGATTADAANAANFSYGVAANGDVFASSPGNAPTPGGKSIPITPKGAISKPAVTAALGRFLGKAIPLVNTGVAIYDLAKELGYDAEIGADGSPQIYRVTQGIVCASNCYKYRVNDVEAPADYLYTPELACKAYLSAHSGNFPAYRFEYMSSTPGQCAFKIFQNGTLIQNGATRGMLSQVTPPFDTSSRDPITDQQFADAVAARATYNPDTSALPRLVKDLLTSGETLPVSAPVSITGPATVPNPVVRTVTEPSQNGQPAKTTTETTTTHVTYNGDTITYNDTKVTVYNDGTTTTTKTEEKAPEEKVDPCEVNPQSVACQSLDTPSDQVPKTTKTITYAEESTGLGAGSCPAPVTIATSKFTGSISFQAECDFLQTYIRPVVILLAFLAAFFIVAPVKEGV